MIKTLEGVKVVDFTLAAAGPMCSKLLAEYGAEVILVEPVSGVANRPMMQFDYMNANKKSIPLDLKSEKGREIMAKLLSEADVFVTNYRTKAVVKLGLGFEELHRKYPRLIGAYITGYGEEGPMKDAPGFDTTAFWGMAGLMHDAQEKGAPPMVLLSGVGDGLAGTNLAMGILAAIIRQRATGEGTKVSTSLLGSGIYMNYSQLYYWQTGIRYPKSRLRPNRALQNTYPCSDGYFILTTLNFAKDFPRILTAAGREDLIGDPRWTCMADTENEKGPELREILDEAFSKYTLAEMKDRFREQDLAFGEVSKGVDALTNPQVLDNKMLFTYEKPDGRKFTVPATPVKFGDIEPADFTPGPALGRDTVSILRELGYDENAIRQILEDKVSVQA